MTTGHTPSWQVVGVFDPDGTGADFAYTVGLIDAGAPAELHTWARPTDGLDPGDDWAFSLRDRQSLLNLHGRRAIDGLLRPGDTEGSTERFGQTWDRAGCPTHRVDAPPDARPPHDVWAACARAAVMGAGAPVVPELLPEWYDAVDTGSDAADGDRDRAIEAVLATLDVAATFVPD